MVYGRVCLPLHLVDIRRIGLLFLFDWCVLRFFLEEEWVFLVVVAREETLAYCGRIHCNW